MPAASYSDQELCSSVVETLPSACVCVHVCVCACVGAHVYTCVCVSVCGCISV